MRNVLEDQFKYYLDHQQDFVEKYNNKHIVIYDGKLFGVYNSQAEAYQEASKKLPLGKFLIQLVTPGKDAYTMSYHSRVSFT